VLRAIQAEFTAFGDPAERLRRVGDGEGEMDLLDGGFGVELELVPDATELVLHRVVVPARQRLLHGSAPELVRDKREPVLSVWLYYSPSAPLLPVRLIRGIRIYIPWASS